MSALDELLASWRANPDAESTLTLCSQLGGSGQLELVREVGSSAEAWHLNDAEVMLAVGRMYLEAGLFAEAQSALVTAGKANARDFRAFRFLGEVLLRRGDAIRAEKVLARAIQLGQGDGDSQLWHDRSIVYVALQKRVGPEAVAAEVARSLPLRPSIAPPAMSPHWNNDESPTMRRSADAPLPLGARPDPAPAAPAQPRQPAPQAVAPAKVAAPPRSAPPPAARKPKSVPPPLPPWGASGGAAAAQALAPAPVPEADPPPFSAVPSERAPAAVPQPALSPAPPLGGIEAQPAPAQAPIVPAAEPYMEDETATHVFDPPNPEPAVILQHLARVGVYEPGGGAPPAWEKGNGQKSRGSWVFILATLLLAGAGTGAYFYARKVKHQRAELAAHLNAQVATMLEGGSVEKLRTTNDKLKRVFELDSRSQRAAKLWLENRVLGLLMLAGDQQGVDSAIHRARKVKVPEKDLAYARIASFLADGDLAGAAALLPKWDKKAGDQALYQFLAGSALERAGDQRAIERYQAARDRDPKLVIAQVMLARLVLLEVGVDKGKPLVDALEKRIGKDRPSVKALKGLEWAVDPTRPKELPADAKLTADERKQLPQPLTPVPYMVDALGAIAAGEHELASKAIESGVGLSESPAVATRLGFLAIQAGNEKLARKAALRALQFAAVYPGARVLASRVALLGGRIAEAKKAIQELDPKAPEVAVVRAVIGYEALDPGDLSEAVQALGDTSERPDLAALVAARKVLSGEAYPDADGLTKMATPTVPWGQIVALDAALDTGQLDLAGKLVSGWSDETKKRPVFALRLARLLRYQGKAEDAVKASSNALEQGNVTARDLIERVYDLLDGHYTAGARTLIAKYPSVLGPMTGYLQVLADAKQHKKLAKVKAAQLDLPSDAAPLLLRTLAARAMAAVGDKRAKKYVKLLLKQYKTNPELLQAKKDL